MSNILEQHKGYYIEQYGNIIITNIEECDFGKDFKPKLGQKLFIKCPNCERLHRFRLGQGQIVKDNLCKCGLEFDEKYNTKLLFHKTDISLLYSDVKYLEPFIQNSLHLNNDKTICINVAKVIGEPNFLDNWRLDDVSGKPVADYLRQYPNDYIMININDTKTILYLIYHDVPTKNILIAGATGVHALNEFIIDIKTNIKN